MTSSTDNSARPVNALWADELVDEWARCGMRHCCLSPGSRSTPLVIAFDDHPDIECFSIIDERSAAFFALGLARATDRPVGLVCTSGTAAANWMPAVCEADRAGVPLILMTADRPPRLRDTGAPQSMDQLDMFGTRTRWFHEFELPEAESDAFRSMLSRIDLAWERARDPVPGPVHLNVPFRKPLEPLAVAPDHRDAVPDDFEPPSRTGNLPFSGFSTGTRAPDPDLTERLVDRLAAANRPLFLCGADRHGAKYRDALCELAADLGAPILAEPTSQLRFGVDESFGVGDYLFDSDFYDRPDSPDLIVRTGEAPLTWAGRQFVADSGAEQLSIQPNVQRRDPDHVVDRHFVADEAQLFEHSLDQLDGHATADGWLARHREASEAIRTIMSNVLTEVETLEEPRMWWELQQLLPMDAALFVSNSMPVRNLDMYAPGVDSNFDVYFNRGLNGIDGVPSTSLGVAAGTDTPTVVVTGDVAFRHDVGSLATADRTGSRLTIIVVDNGGGAIFDQLPIAECGSVHERQFVTDPKLDIAGIGDGFGIPVSVPDNWEAFGRAVTEAVASDRARIVWLRTSREHDRERAESIRRRVVDTIENRERSGAAR